MSLIDSDCSTYIPFKKTGFFSTMMCDYIDKSKKIEPYYHNFPDINGFKSQIEEKQQSFSKENRTVLVAALKDQYKNINVSDKTMFHIDLLADENTFTVTTGHQLNLFTGPLYFLYKIISAINLAEELKSQFPEKNFVPIYWMATEDHDFEEINFFNFRGKKIQWNSEQSGAVGRFSTEGLEAILDVFKQEIGNSERAKYLQNLFEEGYVKHTTLTEATRYIANELFAAYGLVIVDADERSLKQLFVPYVKKELLNQVSFNSVTSTSTALEKVYHAQVNPREINLFYLTDELRERIVLEEGVYKVNNTDIQFTESQILAELNDYPERFSPNVIMRPLLQEVILPNLCYIGGGGEMAYWMQLKSYFETVSVPFPILLLRNSVQVISEKQFKKLGKLSISVEELFYKQNDLLAEKVLSNSESNFDFKAQKQVLEDQFATLRDLASKTDASFVGAVNAQEKKQLKGLQNLEKRFLRAEKRKQSDLVTRITLLQNEILPNQSLEERQRNFSEFYLEYGNDFIKELKKELKPLQLEFFVLVK
ncbi:bacillithiol biosynthesis cysteine-adding enzyme BshC [Tenacibaculum sp. M341]|uniref:bacillithiol biosynthesis cysteine-adding enzyme BshC n=1 Tax=Tenacibaculum sp. M341 TaxID=2530339 RepID=UPI00104802AF|nr:bacillithiol biosynthesis cysteine-adding enzyme BshC [Tenacibaculum sp. M341]TCI89995.1 bacillithiol biosynthesis cysteine-adding enzyme BshC [Tenacibaculum sp. M341]